LPDREDMNTQKLTTADSRRLSEDTEKKGLRFFKSPVINGHFFSLCNLCDLWLISVMPFKGRSHEEV
jgi:hypothetical protein